MPNTNGRAPAFIHSQLDDAGLDVYEFRIYGRIARRGDGCHESERSMAEGCGISRGSVRKAIQGLLDRHMIACDKSQGKRAVYRLTESSEWRSTGTPDEPVTGIRDVPVNDSTGTPDEPDWYTTRTSTGTPDEPVQYKGTPIKVLQEGDSSKQPPSLHDIPFLPEAGEREDDGVELSHLADVKVPLSDTERHRYAEAIEEVWRSVPRDNLDALFRATFGKTMRGAYSPSGFQVSFLRKHSERFPWEWLVPMFVVASSKSGGVDSADAYAEKWLERLAPAERNSAAVPFRQNARGSPNNLPPPSYDSLTESMMEAECEMFDLSEQHFTRHETSEGPRWTITETGQEAKRAYQRKVSDQRQPERLAS